MGVAVIVKMKSSNLILPQQPRHNLFDVLGLIMMARVDQDPGLRAGCSGQQKSHSPVSDVCVVEGRLKGFIFNQQTLLGRKVRVSLAQSFFKPLASLSDVRCTGITGSIGKPKGDIPASQLLGDFLTFKNMLQSGLANLRVRVTQGSMLVDLILK